MSYYFYSILFIIGLAVGSFLNVVIFRFKPENAIFDLKKSMVARLALIARKRPSLARTDSACQFFHSIGEVPFLRT